MNKMAGKHMVSVIMPAYNAEKYIEEAIQSVIDQTYPNWEMLIVDDGSVDSTAEIILRYASVDSRVKLHRFEKNRGACAALNEALGRVQGKFVCWLSADDRYHSSMLQSSVEFLLNNPDKEAVFSRHEFINEYSEVIEIWNPNPEYLRIGQPDCFEPYRTLLFVGNAFNACSVMATKNAFAKAGLFDRTHPYAGDYEYMLRLVAYSDIGFINEINVQINTRSSVVSGQGRNDLDAICVFEEMLYRDDIRKKLFSKAGLRDGRYEVLIGLKNRLRMYTALNYSQEIAECRQCIVRFLEGFPRILEADKYCNECLSLINSQRWDEAKQLLQGIPDEICNFMNQETYGIIAASVMEYDGEYEKEKEILETVLKENPANYEARYMLGTVLERQGNNMEALENYVAAVKNSRSNEKDYKELISNLKNFINNKF